MKLSVIVPAYNLEDYIEECLRSALEQNTSHEFEVVVCDDCSTDNTAKVIARLRKEFHNLRPIYKPQNQGLAKNMQTLLAECHGQYIAYLDGDDVALPSKFQKQIDYLDAHADCHMVFHESDMFDSETNQTIKLYSQQHYNWSCIPTQSSIDDLIQYGTYMQASSVMFRNHANLTNTIDKDCDIILDYPFYILNAGYLQARIDFIPEVLGRYRIHPNSFGQQTSRSVERRIQSLRDIERACQLGKGLGVDESIIEQGIAHHRFAAALYFLAREEWDLFQQLIESSNSNQRFFNRKHELAFEHRHKPKELAQLLMDVA
jgi:glycosyltransferase involved in cell wall biosynthesis